MCRSFVHEPRRSVPRWGAGAPRWSGSWAENACGRDHMIVHRVNDYRLGGLTNCFRGIYIATVVVMESCLASLLTLGIIRPPSESSPPIVLGRSR